MTRPYAPAREDGLKPWRLSYYFRGGAQYEIVYARNASDARVKASLPKVHSVRRLLLTDADADSGGAA